MKRIKDDVQRLGDQVEQQKTEILALKAALIALRVDLLGLIHALGGVGNPQNCPLGASAGPKPSDVGVG